MRADGAERAEFAWFLADRTYSNTEKYARIRDCSRIDSTTDRMTLILRIKHAQMKEVYKAQSTQKTKDEREKRCRRSEALRIHFCVNG
eukprot:COSAG02_NODE_1239_length_13713_cov_37.434259_9_plen_88_part_00